MKKHKAKVKKETVGELGPQLVSEVSSAIKALNLPAGSNLIVRQCGCKQRTLFLDQRQQGLGRSFVRQLIALAGKFGLNFSTQLVCPECGARAGGDTRLEIAQAGAATSVREIPLAISNPNASKN